MGNQLEKPSINCLPKEINGDNYKEFVTNIKYIKPLSSREIMWSVKVPDNWSIICYDDRGDIWKGYLLDEKQKQICSIRWISKGGFDNEASMRITHPEQSNQLNISKCDYNQKTREYTPNLSALS